jgi:hypothetical protein
VTKTSERKTEYNNWYNTWYRLSNSKRILKGKRQDWKNSCPNEPGFYLISCPNIPFPERYLKIGIGQGMESSNKGLRKRLYDDHFGCSTKNSILNKKIGFKYKNFDEDLYKYVLKKFEKNLINKEDRRWFLENQCIVQFISSKKLYEKYGDLKPIEKKIEDNFLRPKEYVRLMSEHDPLHF